MRIAMSGIMFDDRPIAEAIEAAGEIGYQGFELRGRDNGHLPSGTSVERVREIEKMLDEEGLKATCIASFTGNYGTFADDRCEKEFQAFKKYCDLARELDCDLIRHWAAQTTPDKAEEKHWSKATSWIQKAADYADQLDLRIAIEIHHGTLLETVDSSLKFLEKVSRENVGLIHDAANMYIARTEYGFDAIKRLGKRIFNVHVKDAMMVTTPTKGRHLTYKGYMFENRLIDRGGVDQQSVFKGLKAIDYNGYVTVESSGLLDPRSLAKDSYNEIKKLLKMTGSSL